jgi:hypothetical protein
MVKSFEKAFATPLIPTNMKGVYCAPPPPEDLDLAGSSDETLLNYGFLVPRPKPRVHSSLVAAWNMISGRRWQHIVPQLGPLDTPYLKPNKAKKAAKFKKMTTGFSEPGYSGCSLPGYWTTVFATWNCPQLSVPPQGLPAGNQPRLCSWVGIDGGQDSNGDSINSEMLQACFGHSLDFSTNPPSTRTQSPWWMWFPGDPNDPSSSGIPISGQLNNFPVTTGDVVFVSIGYRYFLVLDPIRLGPIDPFAPINPFKPIRPYRPIRRIGPFGVIDFRNVTTSVSTTLFILPPQGAKCPGASIEWIVENINCSNGIANPVVPAFSPFQFTLAGAGDPANGGVSITMQDTTISGNPGVTDVTIAPSSVTVSYTPGV